MGTLSLKKYLDSEFGESVERVVLPEKLSVQDIMAPENVTVNRAFFGRKSERDTIAIIRRKICDFYEKIDGAKVEGCNDGNSVSIITKCHAAFCVTITAFHDDVRIRVIRSC